MPGAALGRAGARWFRAAAMAPRSKEIAVVGGGLAGSLVARLLAERHSVTLYDMGRSGFGGRCSTRQAGQWQHDHGCQFIRAKTPEVARLMQDLEAAGAVQRWDGVFGVLNDESGELTRAASTSQPGPSADFCGLLAGGEAPWVGVPRIAAACSHLADAPGVTQRPRSKVTGAERLAGGGWQLRGATTGGEAEEAFEQRADFLVLADLMTAIPDLPGSVDFGDAAELPLLQQLRRPGKVPLFSLMAVTQAAEPGFAGAVVQGSLVFQWLALDSSKPGRERADGRACWVAVTHADYAHSRLQDWQAGRGRLEGELAGELQRLLARATGRPVQVLEARAQRWASGFKSQPLPERSLLDEGHSLAACGDFCAESSAEGALLSARHAAARILEHLG